MAESHSTDAGSSRKSRFDLTGKRFGRLLVLGDSGKRYHSSVLWRCRCDCGNEKSAPSNHLKSGFVRSCGCLRRESSQHLGRVNNIGKRSRKHGLYQIPEYKVWSAMIQRCTNPRNNRYSLYGARGIAVCDRWLSFENFIADMGRRPSPKHSIDRIDNAGDYCPGNCRWATQGEQLLNTRRNHILTFGGTSLPITAWARKIGVHPNTLRSRLNRGWPLHKALSVDNRSNQ